MPRSGQSSAPPALGPTGRKAGSCQVGEPDWANMHKITLGALTPWVTGHVANGQAGQSISMVNLNKVPLAIVVWVPVLEAPQIIQYSNYSTLRLPSVLYPSQPATNDLHIPHGAKNCA